MSPSVDPAAGSSDTRKAEGYVGIALYGCVMAGLGGLGIGLLGLFFSRWEAAAVGVAASAIAFGSLANALLRR